MLCDPWLKEKREVHFTAMVSIMAGSIRDWTHSFVVAWLDAIVVSFGFLGFQRGISVIGVGFQESRKMMDDGHIYIHAWLSRGMFPICRRYSASRFTVTASNYFSLLMACLSLWIARTCTNLLRLEIRSSQLDVRLLQTLYCGSGHVYFWCPFQHS